MRARGWHAVLGYTKAALLVPPPTSYDISKQSTHIVMRKFKDKASRTFKTLLKPSSRGSGSTPSSVGRPSLQSEPEEQPVVQRVSGEQQDPTPTTGTTLGGVNKADLDQAGRALSSLKTPGEHVAKAFQSIEPTAKHVKSSYKLWEPLLEKVQVFASLVEKISDIHPYAKIASTVLLSIVKPVIAQDKRDKAMADLFVSMYDLYDFIVKAGLLPELDGKRMKLLKNMSMQIAECAYFIRDKAQVENFWVRAGKNAIFGPQIDSKIAEFTKAFKDLRRCFTEHGVLNIEIKLAVLEDIRTIVELSTLTHVRGAGLNVSKACLEGTRQETLNDLIEWINNPQGPAVRFLLGGAGTGKSSVAHSIGKYFKGLRRLGAFFCFDRSFQGDRHPETVFSTIAHNLASWNPDFRRALAEVLRDQRDLADSKDIAAQWDGLIVEPLKRFPPLGPVLIVIDAFDESSDARSRHLLLKHLTEGSMDLPANIRILITSRPEHDIMRVVGHSQDAHLHISHAILDHKEEATSDIELYVRHELVPDDSLSDEALDDADFRLLATKAEGLFQWAATACRIVLQNPAGLTLKERFDSRLSPMLQGNSSSLDDLYRTILEQLFRLDEPVLAERFRSVMGQVLCASSPLSIDSLDELRRLATGGKRDEVTLVVQYMGPLLSGVSDRTSPILPLHTSFRDFLTTESRSKEWFVDLTKGHPVMALGCFRVMNIRLSFNICRLDTSYIPNR
ncbi:hypothetical protein BD309DRAFT_735177, partial [Dichomitus squalens]